MVRAELQRAVGVALCSLLPACGGPGQSANTSTQANAELRRMFTEDQAARSGPIESIDHDALMPADSARRVRVRELEREGALRHALDFHHAAMILQHGRDSLDYLQANTWARRGERMDSTNVQLRWLVAATWDRYQMSRGEPQWYGTQTDRVPRGTGRVVLYRLDTTRVTDRERLSRGVGTLRALQARVDSMNRRLGFADSTRMHRMR